MVEKDDSIVRCFCCSNWVRLSATRIVETGERSDLERWCFGCINAVDSYTESITEPEDEIVSLDLIESEE